MKHVAGACEPGELIEVARAPDHHRRVIPHDEREPDAKGRRGGREELHDAAGDGVACRRTRRQPPQHPSIVGQVLEAVLAQHGRRDAEIAEPTRRRFVER